MWLLALQRLMSLPRARQRRRRQQILLQNASVNKRKGSPCQQDSDGDSQSQAKIMRCSIPDLPEDIWHHIHSLMPLRAAARAACLSHAFLRSWRCYPNLTLSIDMLASKAHVCERSYSGKINCILRNHSGGLKVVSTPMLPHKFLYLKHLSINLISGLSFSPSYDFFSLVSFLYASPCLDTLILNQRMKHESVVGDSSHLRQMPEQRHSCLKNVNITGFSSSKGLVELVCHILKNAVSLESMTLDTIFGRRCSGNNHTLCFPESTDILKEVSRAVTAIREYIEDKVPSTVHLLFWSPAADAILG